MDKWLIIGASGVWVTLFMWVWSRSKKRNWDKVPMQMSEQWLRRNSYRMGTQGKEPWE